MPKFCAVVGCNNTSENSSSTSLHEFPKDPHTRKKWENFVRVHRSNFVVSGIRSSQQQMTPTGRYHPRNEQAAPAICGLHFLPEDYENLMAYQLGFHKKRILRKGALPSIQPSKEVLDKLRTSVTTGTSTSTSTDAPRPTGLYDKPRPPKRQRIGDVRRKLDMARMLSSNYTPPEPKPKEKHPKTHPVNKKQKTLGDAETLRQHAAIQVDLHLHQKSKGTQVFRQAASVAIQCNIGDESRLDGRSSASQPCQNYDDPFDWCDQDYFECAYDDQDPDYEPSSGDWVQERLDIEEDLYIPPASESIVGQHYIVAAECIEELLKICPMCAGPATCCLKKTSGIMVEFERTCTQSNCGYRHLWRSQKMIRKMAVGNLLLSASILFGGLQPSHTLRLFDHMKIPRISESTFYRHQRLYLEPVVLSSWAEQQEELLAHLQELNEELVVTGDGRCDSPGYSAKFGAYTLLESRINRVISLELVQSNEVPNSSWMENEGLKRCVEDLKGRCPKIGTIVTDRHKQNNAWIRENLTKKHDTKHFYDIWHVAKGLGKKIHKLSCQRDCVDAGLWRKSIINHLYWSAGSTADGNSEVMKAKWLSCLNHMANKHSGHGSLFPECAHGPLESVKWLHPGSKVLEKLSELIDNKYLLADIGRLSPKHQTSSLESFHAVIIRFAPKSTAFSFLGMKCRLLLAAMHYNENADRPLAFTAQNEPKLRVAFSRSTYGAPFLRQEKTEPTFSYVNDLKAKLIDWYRTTPERFSQVLAPIEIPPTLASMREKPSKEEMLTKRVQRFVQE